MDRNIDNLYRALLVIDCCLNQEIGDVEGHTDMKEIRCSND